MSFFTKRVRTQRLISLGFFSAILAVSVTTINSTRILAFGSPNSQVTTKYGQHITQPNLYAINSFDKQFVTAAAQGNLAEVEVGKLALKQATQTEVKQFAERMVQDHTQAYNELKVLARQQNITFPTGIGKQNQATLTNLSKLSGSAFDQTYMNNMVEAHIKTESLCEQEGQQGEDPVLKTWAAKILPTVKEHLQMARSIVGNDNGMNK
jgi:putative membrane protein